MGQARDGLYMFSNRERAKDVYILSSILKASSLHPVQLVLRTARCSRLGFTTALLLYQPSSLEAYQRPQTLN